jgi:dinuclear metal center YbgI/SA1388 family protein
MLLKEITTYLDKLFKKDLAFSWDNCGLLIGDLSKEITRILIALDVDFNAVRQAKDKRADLIISHHPLIFNPLKRLTSESVNEKIIMDVIKNDIAVYSAHTNMDAADFGIGSRILKELGLKQTGYLEPAGRRRYKFVVFVPADFEEKIRQAMCEAGGGTWKDYSCCTFGTEGKGTFRPGSSSSPFIGEKGMLSEVEEIRMECIVNGENLEKLSNSVIKAHPYEEPAYDIYALENRFPEGGIGQTAEFDVSVSAADFLKSVKEKLGLKNLRFVFSKPADDVKIKKVLLINGSADSVVENMLDFDFDALLCGEISYHNCAAVFEKGILVAEIGHAESEVVFTDMAWEIIDGFIRENKLDIVLYKGEKPINLWRYFIE